MALGTVPFDDLAYRVRLLACAFSSMTPLDAATAVKTFYGAGVTAADLARAMRSVPAYSSVTALQMGTVLAAAAVFGGIAQADMRTALLAAGYAQSDVDSALAQLFPPAPAPTPKWALRFDGAGTAVTLEDIVQQIQYRDAGNQNQLVDLANDGFTIEASIWPERVDDAPIVSLIYDNMLPAGFSAGDMAMGVALAKGFVCVSAVVPTWQSGSPSNPTLVTVTSTTPVAAKAWNNVTAVWGYGGMVQIFIGGVQQRLAVTGSKYAQSDPLMGTVGTFIPAGYYFAIGAAAGNRRFTGVMRNVRIWRGTRAPADIAADKFGRLSPDEIVKLQTKQPGGYPLNGSWLGGYWPLDEGTGTVAHDLTKVQNNGTIASPNWVPPPAA